MLCQAVSLTFLSAGAGEPAEFTIKAFDEFGRCTAFRVNTARSGGWQETRETRDNPQGRRERGNWKVGGRCDAENVGGLEHGKGVSPKLRAGATTLVR